MNSKRHLLGLIVAFGALLLGGCATAAKSSAMVAVPTTQPTKHRESLAVNVTGGSETSSMGASQISDASFADAIKASITQSGLFSKIASADVANYKLDVQIVRLAQPTFGLAFPVTMESTWRMTRRSDDKLIWEKSITTPFTASMGDAFVGVTRLRLANEGAAHATIQEAITQMGALSLP